MGTVVVAGIQAPCSVRAVALAFPGRGGSQVEHLESEVHLSHTDCSLSFLSVMLGVLTSSHSLPRPLEQVAHVASRDVSVQAAADAQQHSGQLAASPAALPQPPSLTPSGSYSQASGSFSTASLDLSL